MDISSAYAMATGTLVELHSLKRADLNGRSGKVVAWDGARGRAGVAVEGLPKPVSVSPNNLRITERVSTSGSDEAVEMEAFKRVCTGDVEWLARNWLDMGHPIDALLGFAFLPALALAAMEGQVRVVKLLLERGAGVDVPSEMGVTPLKSAAAKGHLEIVKLLLASGADATARDNSGATAIDSARDRGHTEVLQVLQEHVAASKWRSAWRSG